MIIVDCIFFCVQWTRDRDPCDWWSVWWPTYRHAAVPEQPELEVGTCRRMILHQWRSVGSGMMPRMYCSRRLIYSTPHRSSCRTRSAAASWWPDCCCASVTWCSSSGPWATFALPMCSRGTRCWSSSTWCTWSIWVTSFFPPAYAIIWWTCTPSCSCHSASRGTCLSSWRKTLASIICTPARSTLPTGTSTPIFPISGFCRSSWVESEYYSISCTCIPYIYSLLLQFLSILLIFHIKLLLL